MKSTKHSQSNVAGHQKKKRNGKMSLFLTWGRVWAGTLWTQLFDFWKTLPDSLKSAAVLSILSAGAILMTWLNDHRNRAEHEQLQLADTYTVETIPQADRGSTKIAGRLGLRRSPQPAGSNGITGLRESVGSQQRPGMFLDLSIAHQTLERGNYGESYRQFKAAFESLPEVERTRLVEQSKEAQKSYAKGEFHEAAYQMHQAFQARLR